MSSSTTSSGFFEAKYQHSSDPWNFATSSYELNRYAAIVGSLKSRRFERAFEAGCSIGVLTLQLASFCSQVEALDFSKTAVQQAHERCRHLPHVNITVGSLPTDIPEGSFDLVVLSEVGYYFAGGELASIVMDLLGRLQPQGVLLAAHWLGCSEDHLLTGDQVHEVIGDIPGVDLALSERHDGYRIDHWRRA